MSKMMRMMFYHGKFSTDALVESALPISGFIIEEAEMPLLNKPGSTIRNPMTCRKGHMFEVVLQMLNRNKSCSHFFFPKIINFKFMPTLAFSKPASDDL